MEVLSEHRLPVLLQEQISAAHKIGFYENEAELITDAVNMLFASRREVRHAIAFRLYERGVVSLGKGSELAGMDIVSFKKNLDQKQISRVAPESLEATLEMASHALNNSGRE
jgi:predicted HTH domain antitoxin